ncbi:MAG: DUF6513 domain-containing protein [Planctomycetota bacterium]
MNQREHIHFVTGRLAERGLRQVLEPLAAEAGFDFSLQVMPITVAALMTPEWIARRLELPPDATRLILPGYCDRDLQPLNERASVPVEIGPRDFRRLPQHFSREPQPSEYGAWDIEIIAEINHCPRLPLDEILAVANRYSSAGADIIDVGCEPGDAWPGLGDAVRALVDAGHAVSVDSMNPREIADAAHAGASLVLSVNSSNREAALDWGLEAVVVPDDPKTLTGLDDTIELLAKNSVPLRIDPILEPIGFGFAQSLGRYLSVRQRYPDAEMMMGVGNLTELTDADSAGINTLLLGFCQETGIRSILTTEVINWARTSVQECDRARRLVYHAANQGVPPKHLEPGLLMLRDAAVTEPTTTEIAALAADVRDNNYRVFTSGGEVHLVGGGLHLHDQDPFAVMEALRHSGPDGALPKNLDAGHAFYLGYEACKAATAITLGKQYEQDEALDWGLATRPESRRLLRKRGLGRKGDGAKGGDS